VLLTFVAIAIDGGLLMDRHREAQKTADAAAMAAAEKLFANWMTYQGKDTNGKAADAARDVATQNGYPNVTVHIPPETGPFAGKDGYAEVLVETTQKRYFSTLLGSEDIKVKARSVSQGRWVAAKMGILVLDLYSSSSLVLNGGGAMTVVDSPTIVNSNAPDAANATGGGTAISPEFDITGVPGIAGSGTWTGTIYSGQQPTPDPLRYLPDPDPSTMTVQSNNATHVSGTQTLTVWPGVYKKGIEVSGQGTLIMMPGIYYMDGGGFSFTGQGSLQAEGVMIVNDPKSNSDNISITGTGSIKLTPMTTGIYSGISLWQRRSATNTLYVDGNGGNVMTGTFYAPNGLLNVTGNGSNDVIGSQYISKDLKVSGNGSFKVNWKPDQVAKTRILTLVE